MNYRVERTSIYVERCYVEAESEEEARNKADDDVDVSVTRLDFDRVFSEDRDYWTIERQ